ncbi:MAG: thioredoxin family protein [Verrucomicrobiota bacterium]
MKARVMLGMAALLLASCDRLKVSTGSGEELIETAMLSSGDFESFIATEGKVVAVMFHADWCGPCKEMAPTVEAVVEEFGGQVVFGKIDVDDDGELAKSLGVNGIPDVRLYRNGVMVDAMMGAIPKEQVRNHVSIQVDQLGGTTGSADSPTGQTAEPAIRPMEENWRPPGLEPR